MWHIKFSLIYSMFMIMSCIQDIHSYKFSFGTKSPTETMNIVNQTMPLPENVNKDLDSTQENSPMDASTDGDTEATLTQKAEISDDSIGMPRQDGNTIEGNGLTDQSIEDNVQTSLPQNRDSQIDIPSAAISENSESDSASSPPIESQNYGDVDAGNNELRSDIPEASSQDQDQAFDANLLADTILKAEQVSYGKALQMYMEANEVQGDKLKTNLLNSAKKRNGYEFAKPLLIDIQEYRKDFMQSAVPYLKTLMEDPTAKELAVKLHLDNSQDSLKFVWNNIKKEIIKECTQPKKGLMSKVQGIWKRIAKKTITPAKNKIRRFNLKRKIRKIAARRSGTSSKTPKALIRRRAVKDKGYKPLTSDNDDQTRNVEMIPLQDNGNNEAVNEYQPIDNYSPNHFGDNNEKVLPVELNTNPFEQDQYNRRSMIMDSSPVVMEGADSLQSDMYGTEETGNGNGSVNGKSMIQNRTMVRLGDDDGDAVERRVPRIPIDQNNLKGINQDNNRMKTRRRGGVYAIESTKSIGLHQQSSNGRDNDFIPNTLDDADVATEPNKAGIKGSDKTGLQRSGAMRRKRPQDKSTKQEDSGILSNKRQLKQGSYEQYRGDGEFSSLELYVQRDQPKSVVTSDRMLSNDGYQRTSKGVLIPRGTRSVSQIRQGYQDTLIKDSQEFQDGTRSKQRMNTPRSRGPTKEFIPNEYKNNRAQNLGGEEPWSSNKDQSVLNMQRSRLRKMEQNGGVSNSYLSMSKEEKMEFLRELDNAMKMKLQKQRENMR